MILKETKGKHYLLFFYYHFHLPLFIQSMEPNHFGSSHTRLAAQIDGPILVGHQTYVLEPPLTDTTRRLWYSDAFIPYSIA